MIQPLHADDPTHVGSYLLLGRLAAGGMGRVYVGRSPSTRVVAIKMIHSAFATDEHYRARFQREATIAASVGGHRTAQVVDSDAYADLPWMATAFVPGPSLQAAIERNGPLTADSVRVLGAGLAGALRDLHDAGLVHRDLKPDNVLLTPGGPLVIDFGIARAPDSLTLTTTHLGTAPYMSPEQAGNGTVEAPSDIFSLGGVLCFAATGSPAFGTGPSAGVLYRATHAEPDLDRVPDQLRPILAACLAKDPGTRPSPAQLLELLDRQGDAPVRWALPEGVDDMIAERTAELDLLQDPATSPVTEVVTPHPPPAVPRPARRVGWWAAVGAAALAVAAGTFFLIRGQLVPGDGVDTVDSGTFSLTGERLEDPPETAHTARIEITTPDDGAILDLTYAAGVRSQEDGAHLHTTENSGPLLIRTPWTGTLPVDEELTNLMVTTAGEATDITCRITLDDEVAAQSTQSFSNACATGVELGGLFDPPQDDPEDTEE